MKFFNKYIKLVFAVVLAFIVSQFSINNVFIARSPRLNPFFATNLIAKLNSLEHKTLRLFASISFFQKTLNKEQNINDNNNTATSISFKKTSNKEPNTTDNTGVTAKNDNVKDNFNGNNQPGSFTLSKAKIEELMETPLKQVSKGVYAGEKNDTKIIRVMVDEVEYNEYKFNIKGKEVTIRVPRGQKPPTQKEVELLY